MHLTTAAFHCFYISRTLWSLISYSRCVCVCARYKSAFAAPIARVYHRIVLYALDPLLLDSRKHFSCLSPSHHADSSGNVSPERGEVLRAHLGTTRQIWNTWKRTKRWHLSCRWDKKCFERETFETFSKVHQTSSLKSLKSLNIPAARVGPGEEAGVIGTTAHAIVPSTVASSNDHCDLGHLQIKSAMFAFAKCLSKISKRFAYMFPSESPPSGIYARNGIDHFGTITCDPSILVGLRLENTVVLRQFRWTHGVRNVTQNQIFPRSIRNKNDMVGMEENFSLAIGWHGTIQITKRYQKPVRNVAVAIAAKKPCRPWNRWCSAKRAEEFCAARRAAQSVPPSVPGNAHDTLDTLSTRQGWLVLRLLRSTKGRREKS